MDPPHHIPEFKPPTFHQTPPPLLPLHRDKDEDPSPAQAQHERRKRKRPGSADMAESSPYSEMDSIISQKRKPREKTACHPCRKRKVGCDRKQPCQTCIERRHPEFCVYEGPNDAAFDLPGSLGLGDTVPIPRAYLESLMAKVDRLETAMNNMKMDLRSVTDMSASNGLSRTAAESPAGAGHDEEIRRQQEGMNTNNPMTGQDIHVGAHSVPALLMALAQNQPKQQGSDTMDWGELMNGALVPILGLDNESATYPFVDLWTRPEEVLAKMRRIVNVLPPQDDMRRLFRAYKNISHNVFPGVANLPRFEEEFMQFNLRRAEESPETGIGEQVVYGRSLTWMALMFAVLASGCHFCEHLDKRTREVTCKVYISCSFEMLRLANFISNPTLEIIQAMLLFLNVLLNMFNAGVAWVMIGLIIRLAQSLGLHKACPSHFSPAVQSERARVWWAILWQDGMISITYDRAGSVTSLDGATLLPPDSDSGFGTWSYERCMYQLAAIALDTVRERQSQRDMHQTMLRMAKHETEITGIEAGARETIRDINACYEFTDRAQYWIFQLNKSYIISELCRPALSPGAPKSDLSLRMRATCIEALASSVRAWVSLFRVSNLTIRSWPATHRALGSALLLGILKEAERDAGTRAMLVEFLAALEDPTVGLHPSDMPPPVQRSIYWLRKLTAPLYGGASTTSSPMFPDISSEDSPYALLENMMWNSVTPSTSA